MAEKKVEVKIYEVNYICDNCGAGEMKSEGLALLLSFPGKYKHKCTNCDHTMLSANQYPYTVSERSNNGTD